MVMLRINYFWNNWIVKIGVVNQQEVLSPVSSSNVMTVIYTVLYKLK